MNIPYVSSAQLSKASFLSEKKDEIKNSIIELSQITEEKIKVDLDTASKEELCVEHTRQESVLKNFLF